MIRQIDHLVLTVSNIDTAVSFYKNVLLMEEITFAGGRKAVKFGNQKINFQLLGQEKRNHAAVGSGDLCLISDLPLNEVIRHLSNHQIELLEGPVEKSGAMGKIQSIYFSDPDGNLIEVSVYGDFI